MDDWEPGDIALCIEVGDAVDLVLGKHYTVLEVFWGYRVGDDNDETGGVALVVKEAKPNHPESDGFGAEHFRKIGGRKIYEEFMRQVTPAAVKRRELTDA